MLPSVATIGGSLAGAVAVIIWRVRETRTPVSTRKIVVPPLGMATGFCMFLVPGFRMPWMWAAAAFLIGAIGLAWPLLATTRLVRQDSSVMMQRSTAFFSVIIALAAIRLLARGYFDKLLTLEQTGGLFFILAFGMIVRWRVHMLLDYRKLMREDVCIGPQAGIG
jgi:membrane protein CcdC involved in cytochrome C biogenesis